MKVLGIYGSPRKGGNTDLLLDRALAGAEEAGAEVDRIYTRKLKIRGCIECGGCDETGQCVIKDDMTEVYPLLEEARVIFLSVPIFFYAPPAACKALIDRAQAPWNKRRLAKGLRAKDYDGGVGYLIGAGATRGTNLFEPTKLIAKYFFDALDMDYADGVFGWRLDGKDDVNKQPDLLDQAYQLGRWAVDQA